MKNILVLAGIALPLTFASCTHTREVYVVPVTPKKTTTTKRVYTPVKPKPVESAESFRAVEKPSSYSN